VVEYFGAKPNKTWTEMAVHEERLQRILLDFLAANDRITVIGEPSSSKDLRVPVISFTVRGVGSQQLVEAVERRSVYGFRSGHMYSHRLLAEVCGLADVEDGVVRVSFLHYNTGTCFRENEALKEVLTRQQRPRLRDWFRCWTRCWLPCRRLSLGLGICLCIRAVLKGGLAPWSLFV
jgi:selenocysteine lyase/cysteine desulfurase